MHKYILNIEFVGYVECSRKPVDAAFQYFFIIKFYEFRIHTLGSHHLNLISLGSKNLKKKQNLR